jgi:aerobic carbon-monoxide dehydrogenase small subunit
MDNTVRISFKLNGVAKTRELRADLTLLRFLRDGLGYYGTKCGCEIGECGACTVLFNGEAVNACLVLAPQIDGANIWTIEGVAPDGRTLHPIQAAFLESDAVHCGFCSPGMVMSTIALLLHNNQPSEAEIKIALAGNLCRCTGYIQIIEAIKKAATNLDLEKFTR